MDRNKRENLIDLERSQGKGKGRWREETEVKKVGNGKERDLRVRYILVIALPHFI